MTQLRLQPFEGRDWDTWFECLISILKKERIGSLRGYKTEDDAIRLISDSFAALSEEERAFEAFGNLPEDSPGRIPLLAEEV